jgi:hypothetical protein
MTRFLVGALAFLTFGCFTAVAQSIALLASEPRLLPFELTGGYLIVVEGSIGHLQHLHFIVDTGTTHTCVDRRLVRELGLPVEPQTVFRLGRPIRLSSTHLPVLNLGPLRAEKFTIDAADFSLLNLPGPHIDAIVGLDILEAFPFQIDYARKQISFGSFQTLTESASMESVPFLPVISLEVGRWKCRMLIDTGIRYMVFYSEVIQSSGYDLRTIHVETWTDSIGGNFEVRKAVLQDGSAKRGGISEVYLIRGPADGPLVSTDGILSPTAFGIRMIGFDFDRHIVTWTRRQADCPIGGHP